MPEKRRWEHVVGALRKRLIAASLWLCGMVPAVAIAAPVELCAGQTAYPDTDGRVLGHLQYGEALPVDLVAAPPGFALGQPCRLQRAAAVDLTRMLRAAGGLPGVGGTLRGVSCYRSVARQRQVFCAKVGPSRAFSTAAERARYVGPPGYSEHATGYAIDFGIRPSPGCSDVNSCIAAQPAGRWLLSHARDYGFELSFPDGNAQGVTWEPWHWRWVGTSIDAPGAITARAIFARARASYQADPGIRDTTDRWLPVLGPPAAVSAAQPGWLALPASGPPPLFRPGQHAAATRGVQPNSLAATSAIRRPW